MNGAAVTGIGVGTAIAWLIIIGVCLGMWGCPKYHVYKRTHDGQAQLRYAELERQAMVAQAQAERDAAELRSEAIAIIGEASQQFPEYRQQEFIGAFANALEKGHISQILYVPTEANIPITEANRLRRD